MRLGGAGQLQVFLVWVHVASYPGHVGGEKCLSPPAWPGYEARVHAASSVAVFADDDLL